MSEKLEEYIKENRRAFDLASPPEDLWERIEAGLEKKKARGSSRLSVWLRVAASLVILSTIAFSYAYFKRSTVVAIADVNPAYAKKEMKFVSLIEEKKDSLQIYAKDNPKLYDKFNTDLEKLAADYNDLRKELQSSPNQKLIAGAMVRNLEIQLQIISQQLSIINQVNQFKKENQI